MRSTTGGDGVVTPREAGFEPLDPAVLTRWQRFGRDPGDDRVFFPQHLGLHVEAVRRDYCRMRLVFRDELMHAGGVVHGGVLASLLDSVVVPAIGATLDDGTSFSTVDLHVQYLEPLVDDDAVAEGWVVRRGRRTVFAQSEARAVATGRLVATSVCTYRVSAPG